MPQLSQTQMSAYRRMLNRASAAPGMGMAEATWNPGAADIRDRAKQTAESTKTLLRNYYGANSSRDDLVDRMARLGSEGMKMVESNDSSALESNPQVLDALEAIVRTDGTRPSFLVRGGIPDLQSSPIGIWADAMNRGADQLRDAVACVGRIDVPGTTGGFMGTGMLVAPNVIITNRHVLQVITQENGNGNWRLYDGVAIDFGHEFNARSSINRRLLKRVLFAGSRPIDPNAIDHTKLDLALIELEPAGKSDENQTPLNLRLSPAAWGTPGLTIFTVGYPGNPPLFKYSPSLLDQLFHASFGYKRLAPGELMSPSGAVAPWTLVHDATTLAGSSGSALLVLDAKGVVAGLHYGGRTAAVGAPGENWGHKLDQVLGETDGRSAAKLAEVLQANGVKVVGGGGAQLGETTTSTTTPSAAPLSTAAPVNWRKGVTLRTMQTLGSLRLPGLESADLEASQNGTTPPDSFDGRVGYESDFLEGFSIPLPKPQSGMRELRRGGSGFELKYEHFSVVMSAERRMPMITACNIDGSQSRRLPRIQSWKFDGRLDPTDQWGNDLYSNNDIDKGHMVRREDPVWGTPTISKRANVDTFHYTNSCPQMSGVNQVTWLGLENYVLGHTREDEMKISVFTGPFFTNNDFPYRDALIPKSFWKVVAFRLDDGRPSATAYRVSQERELQDLEFVFAGYQTYQISVQQVADATGIDFSAMIPFDGFSQHERVHGTVLAEKIERFEQIRV